MNFKEIKTMLRNDRKHYVGVVSTYKDLRDDTDYVIKLFDTAIEEFTIRELKPTYFSLYFIKGNVKLYKYNSRNYEKVKGLLIDKQLQAVCMYFSEQEYKSNSVIRDDASIQIIICKKQISEKGSKFKTFKNEVSFSVSAKHYYDKLDFLIKWIKEIFVKVNGINGYMDYLHAVNLSGCILSTAHEELSCMNANIFGDYANKLRGYFWMTILTSTHISGLNGGKYVQEKMPAYRIDEVEMENDEVTYFCRLTENIYEFDSNKYLKLKEFLSPLLDDEDMLIESLARNGYRSVEDRRLVFNEQQYAELEKYNKRELDELREEYSREIIKRNEEIMRQIAHST